MRWTTRTALLSVTGVLVSAVAIWAAVTPYSQDFEGLTLADTSALANDGWLVFGAVFDSGGNFIYDYGGVFPAPNDGGGFCQIVSGEGDLAQGTQQLRVFNDYNNTDHTNFPTRVIESIVFQEQTIEAGDVGAVVQLNFDAKLGDLAGSSEAEAFIKTLDPGAGFATTNYVFEDLAVIPPTWGNYSIQLTIDAGLVGQLLQFGFVTRASNNEPSGVFVDNLNQPVPVELMSLSVE